jgi:hypothetical protein
LKSARIIFVPGMKPKPRPEEHRRELCRVLEASVRRVRPAAAASFASGCPQLSLVPWTYRFYGSHRDVALDRVGIDRLLAEPKPDAEEVAAIESLERRFARAWHLLGDSLPWLGALIARPEMRTTMQEVRRYRSDRGGVGTAVRAMLKDALIKAWSDAERVLLIGHSMGSVIAYDALWELSRQGPDGRVDLFVTLGSPLATRFIRRGLSGSGLRGRERYPTNIRRWSNFTARGEMTALRPALRPVFRKMQELGVVEALEDHTGLYNHYHGAAGINVHEAYGYLAHPLVAECIGRWLEEAA